MSRPLLGRIVFAIGVVAGALLAACSQEGAPTEPAPAASTSSLAADAPPPQASIPVRFQGKWTLQLDDCADFQSDGRLVITSQELAFHESRGNVISVSSEGDALTVSAEMSGEGETWEETYSFRLSPDREVLLQPVSPDDEGVRRVRCPTGTPR